MSELETDPLLWAISALAFLVAAASFCAYFLLARKAKRAAWTINMEFSGLVREIESTDTDSTLTAVGKQG